MIKQSIIAMFGATLSIGTLLALGPRLAVMLPVALMVFSPLPPMIYLAAVRRSLREVPYDQRSPAFDRLLKALFVLCLMLTPVLLLAGLITLQMVTQTMNASRIITIG